jgi:hypothetical protein
MESGPSDVNGGELVPPLISEDGLENLQWKPRLGNVTPTTLPRVTRRYCILVKRQELANTGLLNAVIYDDIFATSR